MDKWAWEYEVYDWVDGVKDRCYICGSFNPRPTSMDWEQMTACHRSDYAVLLNIDPRSVARAPASYAIHEACFKKFRAYIRVLELKGAGHV